MVSLNPIKKIGLIARFDDEIARTKWTFDETRRRVRETSGVSAGRKEEIAKWSREDLLSFFARVSVTVKAHKEKRETATDGEIREVWPLIMELKRTLFNPHIRSAYDTCGLDGSDRTKIAEILDQFVELQTSISQRFRKNIDTEQSSLRRDNPRHQKKGLSGR